MKNTTLWNQFKQTGAVEDYLSYRNTGFLKTANNNWQDDNQEGRKGQEKTNAGLSIGDRDGHQGRADWRI